ncbi:MAG: precorrin-6y C5,15-methyltransferase (decarboxylating) subunit CbiE [Desulfosoma sp.]
MSKDPEKWTPPLIVVVGIGSGPKSCVLEGLAWIERADVLVGGTRHLALFSNHSGEKIPLQGSMKALGERLKDLAHRKRVAILASGDPLFFGIGRFLTESFPPEHFHFVPGPTSLQSLCAAIGLPWENVQVFSLHGRKESSEWMWFLRQGHPVAFLTDKEHGPTWIAERLLHAGFDDLCMIVGEDLGLPSQKISSLNPLDALNMDFSALNVVLLIKPKTEIDPKKETHEMVSGDLTGTAWEPNDPKAWNKTTVLNPTVKPRGKAQAPKLGIPDQAFEHRAGLITKKEVRVLALSLLQLASGHVFWDLGAGSGSVSVEAALLCPLKSVWAVEKVAERAKDIWTNLRRFRCGEIHVIEGEALDVLPRLPDPDRVFVGGSGGILTQLLHAVWDRLAPSGRLVVAAVTWQSLQEVEMFSRSQKVNLEALQVQVNRAVPIGSSLRFESLNPVFLCAMEKAESIDNV